MEPMLRAPISGFSRAMWPTRCSMGMPTAPVEKLMMMSLRLRISSMIWRYFSTLKLGIPSSSRAWMWTTAAPASAQRLASSAISTGVYGMYWHCLRVLSAPVSATVMTTCSRLDVSIALLSCDRVRLRRWCRGRTLDDGVGDPLGRLELGIVSDICEFDDVGARSAFPDHLDHVRPRDRVGHAPQEADRQRGLLHRRLPALLVGGAFGDVFDQAVVVLGAAPARHRLPVLVQFLTRGLVGRGEDFGPALRELRLRHRARHQEADHRPLQQHLDPARPGKVAVNAAVEEGVVGHFGVEPALFLARQQLQRNR